MVIFTLRSVSIHILILCTAALLSIHSIHSHELGGGLSSVSGPQHQHQHHYSVKLVRATEDNRIPTAYTSAAVNGTINSLDDMHKPHELSRKRKVKMELSRLKNKKSKKQKKNNRMNRMTYTNTVDNISNAVKRPKGLLFMLRTFFASMFDPTVDGRIDRSLLSRGYISSSSSTSHRIYIPSRHNTYIPGGGKSIPGISGSSTGMTGSGGGGSYSASATGDGGGASAGPVCGPNGCS